MSTPGTTSSGVTLTLTEEERAQLLSLLEQLDRDTLVEVHRTEATDFRQHVERREAILRGLIEKLRRP